MSKELKRIEKQIDNNIRAAWKQNGILLLKIRDENLYKDEYGTFELYLEKRWDYDRSRGYQLINAAEMSKKMDLVDPEMSKIFDKESHAKELLTGLKTDSERLRVAELVTEKTNDGEKVTAAIVREAINDFKNSGEIAPEIDFNELERKHTEQLAEVKAAKEAKKNKPVTIKIEPTEDHNEPSLHDIIDDLKSMNTELESENSTLVKAMESDDKVATLLHEVKVLTATNAALNSRLNGMNVERTAMIGRIKWLEKQLKKHAPEAKTTPTNEVDAWE